MKIKDQLIALCSSKVSDRLQSINTELNKIQEDANSETKSSMGDKYETGRAMAQNEKMKLSQNQAIFLNHQKALALIKPDNDKRIKFGSVICTNHINIFIATALGEITLDQNKYFVISPATPLAKQLIGKQKSDSFQFNSQLWQIKQVEN